MTSKEDSDQQKTSNNMNIKEDPDQQETCDNNMMMIKKDRDQQTSDSSMNIKEDPDQQNTSDNNMMIKEDPDQQVCNQERNSSLEQENPEPTQIKDEQEELCISQEGEQLVVKEEEVDGIIVWTGKERLSLLDKIWKPKENLDLPQQHDCKEEEVLIDQQAETERADGPLLREFSSTTSAPPASGSQLFPPLPPSSWSGPVNKPEACRQCSG